MPPVKRQTPKPRSKSTDSARVVELRKERSRDAARNRRGKENAQFDELAKLLPLPAAITSQLDKASIVRLTISYLSMREFSGGAPQMTDIMQMLDEEPPTPEDGAGEGAIGESGPGGSSSSTSSSQAVVTFKQASPAEETANQLLQAMEGFLMVLSQEGKILYISETVSVNLGLSQVELTGSNIYHYIHPEDQSDLASQLLGLDEMLADGNRGPNNSSHCQQGGGSPFFDGQAGNELHSSAKSFFMRMKCTLVRRGGSYTKSSGFKVIHCMGRMKKYALDMDVTTRKAFVVICQPVLSMNINELPLECNMFVSRVNMDLKIVYCEGRIHKFTDYIARDIVGMSAYDFYHAGDVAVIQNHHAKFLSKGQVWTKYYRWMNKNGGWVWMQTKASLIPHPSNSELKQMLCLNYILSDVEHRSIVLGMAQLHGKPQLTSSEQNLTEVTSDVDPNSGGELKDALIDDQVMVFPKWHATSDKLVPEQTLLDQMALQRTGYEVSIENVFPVWQPPKETSPTAATASDSEIEVDEKDLQDIAEIINSEMTDFDRKLLDYVVSGSIDNIQTKPANLNPIGAYIEEIPEETPTIALSRAGVVVPKVENISMDCGNYSSTGNSCVQLTNVRRQGGMYPDNRGTSLSHVNSGNEKMYPMKRPAGVGMYRDTSLVDNIPSKIPRLSHKAEYATVSNDAPGVRRTATVTSSTMTSTPGQFPLQNPPRQHQALATPSYAANMNVSSSVPMGQQYQDTNPSARLQRNPMETTTAPSSTVTPSYGLGQYGLDANGTRGSVAPMQGPSRQQGVGRSVTLPRKPQNLLEQLIQMPSSGNSADDTFSEDLMFEFFEELLNEEMENEKSKSSKMGKGSGASSNNNLLPLPTQEIKQEVVTPTTTNPPMSFEAVPEQSQFKTPEAVPSLFRNATSASPQQGQVLQSSNQPSKQNNLPQNTNLYNMLPPNNASGDNQQQWVKQNLQQLLQQQPSQQHQQSRVQPTRQQPMQQQQQSRVQQRQQPMQQLPQQIQQPQQLKQQPQQLPDPVPNLQAWQGHQTKQQFRQFPPQTRQPTQQFQQQQQSLQQLQQRQKQLQNTQLQSTPKQPPQYQQYQQQQQQHQQQQRDQQRLRQELFNIIQRNNDSNFGGQQCVDTSGTLPELGNGLDEELSTLPLGNSPGLPGQTLSSGPASRGEQPTSKINNFTGMM